MGDMKEIWNETGERSKELLKSVREAAAKEFPAACAFANANGMTLRQLNNGTTYQLKDSTSGDLLNIYPGNQRIYHDPNHKMPFIGIIDAKFSLYKIVEIACSHCDE